MSIIPDSFEISAKKQVQKVVHIDRVQPIPPCFGQDSRVKIWLARQEVQYMNASTEIAKDF